MTWPEVILVLGIIWAFVAIVALAVIANIMSKD
jgi:hypothetical protein